jgi:WD40 repeat protein
VTIELDGVTQKEVHHSFDHLSLKQWLSESDDWGYNRAGRFSINCQEGSEKIHTWALAEVEANRAHTSPYLVRHLASHLRDNERAEVIGMQLLQFPWLQARLRLAGLNTLLEDFNFCTHQPHNLHSDLAILERALRQATQVFNYCNGWTGGWRSASQWVARHLEGWNQEEQMASQLLARLTEVEGLKSLRLHIAEWLVHNGGAAPRKASLARDDPLRILAIGSCVQAVVVLPDNRLAIGCSDDINIRIWNPDSGECVSVLKGHEQGVFCLVSLGERQLASGSLDHSIRIWDLVSGTCSAILQGHGDGVCSLASLGDGRLASGSIDHTIRIWDLARGECNAIVEGHGGDGVFALAFLGDGALASTSDIGPICLWDPDNGISSAIFEDDGCGKYCLVELSDGRIASGAQDGNIRLWDPAKLVCSGILEGHRSWVWALAMLGDGRIASGSFDNTIRIWDPASGTCSAVFQGHQDWVMALAVLGDGRIASGSKDGTIRLWDPASFSCSAVYRVFRGSRVTALAVLADGRFASGAMDGSICIWDPVSGSCRPIFRGHQGGVRALKLLSDGRIVSGSDDKTIRMWDPRHPDGAPRVLFVADAAITALAWVPTHQLLVAGDASGRLHWLEMGPLKR